MTTEISTSCITCKVKHVRAVARLNLAARWAWIDEELRKAAEKQILFIEEQNKTLFRRLGWTKKIEVPDVETLIATWKQEHSEDKLDRYTSQWWAVYHTQSYWWKTIEALSTLPESMDEDLMQLSIDDARTINFNENLLRV